MIDMNKKYITEQNHPVRIYAIDGQDYRPVHGAILLADGWVQMNWLKDGKVWDHRDCKHDLIEIEE
jgi:hypothetical protein